MNRLHQNAPAPDHDTRIVRSFRASELFYRRLFDEAREGILILDFDTGRIADVNPFLFELLGFSRSEMTGKKLAEREPFRELEPDQLMRERLQKDGRVRYEDLPLTTRDGRKIVVEFTGAVFQARGKKVIQCHVRDLTERQHAADEIRRLTAQLERRVVERTVQLQAANAELQAYGYSVSQDLRAPLRQVGGFVKRLQKTVGASLSEKGRQHLAMISESARLMSELVDDLLAFSRAGRAVSEQPEINLDELIRQAARESAAETQAPAPAAPLDPLPFAQASRALREVRERIQRKQAEARRKHYNRKLQALSRRL